MAHTTRKKTYFLKKRKTKRRGPLEHRLRSRLRTRLRQQTAKPGKNTKVGRAINRRQKAYSRNMRRSFGLNTGRTRRLVNNNIEMENAMKEAERQIKDAQLRRSRRVRGQNIEPEAEAAAAAIASGKRIRKATPAVAPVVPTPTTAYVQSLPPPPVTFGGPGYKVAPHPPRFTNNYSAAVNNNNMDNFTRRLGQIGLK